MKRQPVANLVADLNVPELTSERFEGLDVVALRESFSLAGDASLPGGAEGTIVGIWGGGQAYEVEFTEPVAALVTVRSSHIRRAMTA